MVPTYTFEMRLNTVSTEGCILIGLIMTNMNCNKRASRMDSDIYKKESQRSERTAMGI